MPAGSCERRRRPSCTRGARSSTPAAGSSASTTARSGSRWASGAASASRRGRRPTSSRSMPRTTASWSAPRSCCHAEGSSPTGRRGSPATRPADGPFEADVRIRYRGHDVPSVVEATPDGVPGGVPRAAAGGRARAERGRVSRRRAARRRPHRRVAALSREPLVGASRRRRLPRLSSPSVAERKGLRPEAATAPRQELRHPGAGPRAAHHGARGLRRGIARGRAAASGNSCRAMPCGIRRSARASDRSIESRPTRPTS